MTFSARVLLFFSPYTVSRSIRGSVGSFIKFVGGSRRSKAFLINHQREIAGVSGERRGRKSSAKREEERRKKFDSLPGAITSVRKEADGAKEIDTEKERERPKMKVKKERGGKGRQRDAGSRSFLLTR